MQKWDQSLIKKDVGKRKKQQLGAPHNPLEFVDVRFDDYSDYTSACSSFTSWQVKLHTNCVFRSSWLNKKRHPESFWWTNFSDKVGGEVVSYTSHLSSWVTAVDWESSHFWGMPKRSKGHNDCCSMFFSDSSRQENGRCSVSCDIKFQCYINVKHAHLV